MNSMNTNIGLNSPIMGGMRPIVAPIIPHSPKFPFSSKPRLEAIHVSDLPKDFNHLAVDSIQSVKSPSSHSSPPSIITAILTLIHMIASYFSGGANSQSITNGRNETVAYPNADELNRNITSGIIGQSKRNRYNCRHGFQGRYCDPCGVTFKQPLVKIVGGFEATPHSWPSSALIVFNYKAEVYLQDQRVYYNLDEQMVCGGSLISRDTILSASHCIVRKVDFNYQGKEYTVSVKENKYFPSMPSMYTVYLGLHDASSVFNGGNLEQGAIKIGVRQVINYPFFNEDNLQNDVSLLKLANEVQLNQQIQLACLPDPNRHGYPHSVNVDVFAMGWGTTQQGGVVSTRLRNVKFTLYDHRQCESVLPQAAKNWHTQLCAGEMAGGRDTCQGDSGGSLFLKDNVDGQMKYVAVGIVSYGDGCAKPLTPGLYTKISAFMEWIDFFY